jgi:hypothetical protein
LDLKDKEMLDLTFYAQDPSGMGYADMTVLDAQGGKLAETGLAVNQRTDWDVNHLKFTAKQDGSYIIRALCSQNCRTGKIFYKIIVK